MYKGQNCLFSYKVSIYNIDDKQTLFKDAEMDVYGIVELVHRFLDLSDVDFKIFYKQLREFDVELCSISGKADSQDPWLITVEKNDIWDKEIKLPGFWQRLWRIGL